MFWIRTVVNFKTNLQLAKPKENVPVFCKNLLEKCHLLGAVT